MKKTILTICLGLTVLGVQAQRISLAGNWHVALGASQSAFVNGKYVSAESEQCAVLPGTIDTNHLGIAPADTMETTHLSRISAYKGPARYSRYIEIPKDWKKKPVVLFLERTRPTWVYVDGELIDSCNFISTPQRYSLPQRIKPGRHLLEIVVDNSRGVPEQLYASSHAYTEDTQTNWNGIIGDIRLEVKCEQSRVEGKVLPCFRDFHIEGAHFYADGHKVFLRGKHDAAVWPLTGHVDMTIEGWMKYLSACSEYGINHVRFHSWCPPEAAFVAADSIGIYLQPELPFWGSFDKNDSTLMTFLHQEGVNILREYGHHPSFRMMALGNELWGDIDKMKEFVDDFRRIAPDKYYTFGSNYYLGYQGVKEGMDYFTTCRIGGEGWGQYNTHTRGSFSFADAYDGGMVNHFRPNSILNFDEACDPWEKPQPWQKDGKAGIPIISHETGQFQSYPDFREIKKYTGVLYPYNMEVFRKRLSAAGMLSQADDFHKASGLWSVRLYKADIEMDLRTKNMAGFQLLDIQDYPGQGSAYVGILDAFMESKGFTTPEEWRQWCSPVVPLLAVDRFCFEDGDTLKANVQIANYSGSTLAGKTLRWRIGEEEGTLGILTQDEGLVDVGQLNMVLHSDKATKKNVTLSVEGTDAHNTYEIWIYPKTTIDKKRILVVNTLTDDTAKKLEKGASVLWMPDSLPHTVGGLFQTDYWNYRMFKTICENNKKEVSPGTLGILTRPDHPVFRGFPTEMHTNWQWFPVVQASHPLILDNFPKSCKPIIQVIDNIERNHKLGLLMEWKVGNGKLLVCMSDLEKASQYPEGKAFYQSVLDYMQSPDFSPTDEISVEALRKTLSEKPREITMKELNNISQY